jgi:glycosyltransferase involved in cell wall biosynthesis
MYKLSNFCFPYKINLEKFENKEIINNDIKFIIIMATYNRKNGKTLEYLNKSLESIINQHYKNWDLIVVGDKYEPFNELENIINIFKNKTTNKIILLNNQVVERDHITDKNKLWYCAGANSMNMGLKYARDNNYKYYCHLDDDDYWSKEHLSVLMEAYKYTNCIFANTKSTYNSSYLPNEDMEIYENNRLPYGEGVIHSSFSFRIDIMPFNYDTSHNDDEIKGPADALMLNKIRKFLDENKKYSAIYVSKLTCYHDFEGLAKI